MKKIKNKFKEALKLIAAVRKRYRPLQSLQANYSSVVCTGVANMAKPPEVWPTPLIRAGFKNRIRWLQRGPK